MERKSIWEAAGRTGLILGIVSISYMTLTQYMGTISGNGTAANILISLAGMLLWILKFAGCILIMRAAMKRICNENPDATRSDSFRFGAAAALLSALLYSAYYLAYLLFINPDSVQLAIDTAKELYATVLDKNSLEMMDNMMPKIPAIGFFCNLLWCTLYGVIISAILSRSIPSDNPFESIDDK